MTPEHPTPAGPDDLDRLLASYFKRQVPDPWPACRALADDDQPAAARGLYAGADGLSRSRLTLAASVAALLGLGLAVSSGPQPGPTAGKPAAPDTVGSLLKDAKADGSRLAPPMP